MTKIVKGGNSTSFRFAGSAVSIQTAATSYSPESVSWLGDETFEKTQSAAIDFANPGSVGRIHLLERVYEPGTTTRFCVSADTPDSLGISHVNIYYGGAKPFTETTVTRENGVQGYWFTLVHDDAGDLSGIEERTIYAELVPNNGGLISKVTSKTIRLGTRTVVQLSPSDCQTATTGLHTRIKWLDANATDGKIFELSSGVYYFLNDHLPAAPSGRDPWVEVRAATGHNVEIRFIDSFSMPTGSYQLGGRYYPTLRTKHVVFDGVTLNMWEASQFNHEGYFGCDNCTIIDPNSTSHKTPAGGIGTGRIDVSDPSSNWYAQSLFRAPGGAYTNTAELHNTQLRTLVAGGVDELMNTTSACDFDLFYPPESSELVVNKHTQQVPYGNNDPGLDTLRYMNSKTGTRSGSYVNGIYTYSWADIQDIAQSTFRIDSIDTSDPTSYEIHLDATPTHYPARWVPGTGYSGGVLFYDWLFFRWANGDDLTIANRKLVDKGVADSTLVVSWLVDDTDVNSAIAPVIRVFRTSGGNVDQSGFVFANLGFTVGDRISVTSWAHPDVIQTSSGSGISLSSMYLQDVASAFEQQMLFQNTSPSVNMVFNQCLMIDPTATPERFNLIAEAVSKFSATWKYSSLPHNNWDYSTLSGLDPNFFDVNYLGCVLRDVAGDGGTSAWDLDIIDSIYEGTTSFGSSIGSTSGSTTWSGTLGVNQYGVPASGGNAIKSSTIKSLPYGLDGSARLSSSQVGAIAEVDSTYIPRAGDYFVGFPDCSDSDIHPTAGTTVSVINGTLETDKVSPSIAYQWYTESGAISGATSQSFDTTGRAPGDRLWCLVTHGDATHWVDFGIIQ